MGWGDATGWLVALAALVFLAYTIVDPDNETEPPSAPSSSQTVRPAEGVTRNARVLRVVDGDTIIVRSVSEAGGEAVGKPRRVRYIGVDTPESVKPDAPVECFGKEAATANRKLVEGEYIELVSDKERFDRFGRALAYVYVGGTFVNADLIKNGFAETIEVPPNTAKAKEFAALERVAMRTNKGLWGACGR